MRSGVGRIGGDRLLIRLRGAVQGAFAALEEKCVAEIAPRLRRLRPLGVRAKLINFRSRRDRRWFRICRRVIDFEKLLDELSRPNRIMPNNAPLVDRDGHRHHVKIEKIERIDEDRPTELPPLRIESRAIRMLLLHDAHDDEIARFDVGLDGFLPHGQDAAAPGSPRREMDEQHLFATIVRQSAELAV